MISIGIDSNNMLVYEGSALMGRAILPAPIISAAVIVSSAASIIPSPGTTQLLDIPLVFREDSFDSVTRVRRGRFYHRNISQPIPWRVFSHPSFAGESRLDTYVGIASKDLVTFH